MKLWFIPVSLALSFIGTQAIAQTCPNLPQNTRLSGTTLTSILKNKYACVGSYPNATWNELHSSTNPGTVTDYKKGPTDPVDPSAVVGTFAVTTPVGKDGVVTYTYFNGGGTYAYYVQQGVGSQYYFCPTSGGAPVIPATIQPTHC